MTDGPLALVLKHLRQRLGPPPAEGVSDGQLLERFALGREEAAFAALMQRHGPMVLSVCQRVLRHGADVEDAFQATFLMLLRKATSIRRRPSIAGWLHSVAYHLALRAKAERTRRQTRERIADDRQPPQPVVEVAWRELQAILDEELDRLPEKYRTPVVLCYIEGKTHEEAARHLGWPPGTVKGRLARARDLLRRRLTRRGLGPVAGSFATVLAVNGPAAGVPAPLAAATRVAVLGAGGTVSPHVAALVQGLGRTLLLARLKSVAAAVLALSLLTAGGGLLARQLWGAKPTADRPEEPPLPLAGPDAPPPAGGRQAITDLHGDPLPAGALARLGTVRLRPGNQLIGVTFSRDGRIVACGGDRTVFLWEAATGREVRQLAGHENRVTGIAFAPDGRTLASDSADRTLRLWDLTSGAELRRFEGHQGTVGYIVFSPDGRALVSGSTDKTLRLWDVATAKELRRFRDGETESFQVPTWPAAFFPDNRTVATRDAEDRLRLWDATTGRELPRRVSAEAFSPDGSTVAAVSKGSPTVQLWDVATGQELRQCRGHRGAIHALAFSPDGKILASSGADRLIRLWDVATANEVRQVATGEYQHHGLAFSPDGARLASGRDTAIRLWDIATGQESPPAAGHRGQVGSVAFLSDGRTLVSTAMDNTVRLWDTASGKELGRWEGPPQDPGGVRAFDLAPDGKLLACGRMDRTIQLRDAATGREVRQWQGHQGRVSALAFAPDGRTLATGSWDKTVGLWDVATGEELRRLRGPRQEILTVAFSRDGKRVASGGIDGTLHLWDAATGRALRQCGGDLGWVRSVAFSPDGKTLAAVGGVHAKRGARGLLSLWEVATGRERGRWEAHDERAYRVTFSPDGALLASGGGDPVVRLWESATGRELPPSEGHHGAVVSVAFSPDGRRLASGSMDTTVLVWPLEDRLPLRASEPLAPEWLEALWADLAGADAAQAYRAIGTLAGAPEQAVSLLRARLRPQEGDGGSESAPPDLRARRAIEVLERMGTPQARRVLEELTRAAWPAPVAEEAKEALARLSAGPPSGVR